MFLVRTYGLTMKQAEVAELTYQGLSNKEIEALLNRAIGSVAQAQSIIYDKLGLDIKTRSRKRPEFLLRVSADWLAHQEQNKSEI